MTSYQVTVFGVRVYRHWDYRLVAKRAFVWGVCFPAKITPCH